MPPPPPPPPPKKKKFRKPLKFGHILWKIKNISAYWSAKNMLNSGYFITILHKILGKTSTALSPGKHQPRLSILEISVLTKLLKPVSASSRMKDLWNAQANLTSQMKREKKANYINTFTLYYLRLFAPPVSHERK